MGLCPKPHSHLRGRRGQVANPIPTPTVSVGSIQGVKGKMHDFVALDPLHLRGGSKTNRSGRSWKPVKACGSNRVAAWPLRVGGDNASVVRVQEVFPAPLPRGERGCGQRPQCWQDPWGSRSRGKCAVGTHFKGFWVYKAQSQLCVALLGCLVIGGRMSAVSLKLPHAPCAPLSLDNLQVLVQSLPMAFG